MSLTEKPELDRTARAAERTSQRAAQERDTQYESDLARYHRAAKLGERGARVGKFTIWGLLVAGAALCMLPL